MEYADAIIGKASTALTHQYDTSAAMTAEICDRQCFEHPLCEEFFLHQPSGSAQECGENGDKQCVCTLYGKGTMKNGEKESCYKEQCFTWEHRDSVCGGVNVVATELSSKASGETLNSCAKSCHTATGCTQFYYKRSTGACTLYSGACQVSTVSAGADDEAVYRVVPCSATEEQVGAEKINFAGYTAYTPTAN